MSMVMRSVTINAPVEEVYAFASDPARLWTCWDGIAVREVKVTPEVVGSSVRVYTHVFGLHLEGGVEYTEAVPNERIVAEVHFPGEKPTWTFLVEEADGGTTFTARAEWHVGLPGVGRPIEALMAKEHEGELERWLSGVKERLESKAAA